jgi:uncharacterized membrane protein YdjX (TVP38/TMEM64 family)
MSGTLVKVAIGLLIITSIIVVARLSGVQDFVSSGALTSTIEEAGPLAPAVFMFVYALATILFVPGTPLTLIGGALFGPLVGTAYVVVGATVGALGAFLLARYVGGKLISGGVGQVAKRLQSYDEHLCHNGFVTVLLLRLIPLFPFNGLNFGLGLTRLKTGVYLLGTFIGIIPGTFAYVYFGASLKSFDPIHIGLAVLVLVLVSLLGKYLLATYHQSHGK